MKKRVVLVNQSAGYLMTDIANAYADNYDNVFLLAGNIVTNERKLSDKVKVDKIIAYNRKSSIMRIFTWLWGTFQIFTKLLTKYRDCFVIYVTNPPLAYLLAGLLKNQYSLIIYDTYPNALANIGIKKGNLVYNWWAKRNKKLFGKATQVFTLSEGMAQQLSEYVDREKIKVIPNWPAQENLKPINKKDNFFVKQHNLDGKFIVMYSGNIGLTHSVEILTDLALSLKEREDIHFLIIGEGKKKPFLQDFVNKNNLNNCTFLTWQPHDVIPYSLGAADLSLVTLNEETGLLSVPSKTYNLLAVGSPLLCVAPEASELDKLISTYKNGRCFRKENIQDIKSFILELADKEDLKKSYSLNSKKAAGNFKYSNAKEYVINL